MRCEDDGRPGPQISEKQRRIVRPVPLRDRGEDGGTGGLITDCAEQTGGLADLTIVSRRVLQQTQIAAEDGHGRDRRPAADANFPACAIACHGSGSVLS
jgi:hypothetical protein